MDAEGIAGVDAKVPTRRAACAGDLRFRILDVGQDLPGAGEIDFAVRTERQPPRGAVQKLDAEPVLQPRDQLRDRRGAQSERASGGGKTLPLDDPDKRAHVRGGVHIRSHYSLMNADIS